MSENRNKKSLVNILAFVTLLIFIYLGNIEYGSAIFIVASIIPMVIISINSERVFSLGVLIASSILVYIIAGKRACLGTTLVYLLPSYITGVLALKETVRDKNNKPVKILIKMDKMIRDSKKLIKIKTAFVPKTMHEKFFMGENVYKLASLRVFLASIIAFTLGIIIYFLTMKYLMDIDFVKQLHESIKNILDNSINYLKENGDTKLLNEEKIDLMLDNIGLIIIFSIFIESLFLAIISYFVSLPILNKIGSRKIFYVSIDNIVLPGRPVFVLVISVIVLYIIGSLNSNIDTIYMINSYILVMNTLFFLEGASLIIFIIKRWGLIKKNINWIVLAALIIFVGVIPGIAALGMLDSVMNYRLRWLPSLKDNGGEYEE